MLKVRSIQSHFHKSCDPNVFLTLHSQDAISLFVDDGLSQKLSNVNETNSTFSNACIESQKKSEKTINQSQKAAKGSVKKLGATLFKLFQTQRKMKANKVDFEYSSIKQKIKQSSSRVLRSKHKTSRSELSQIRSVELDQQLRLLHSRRQDEKIEKKCQSINGLEKDRGQLQSLQFLQLSSLPQFTTQKTSKNIPRKIQPGNKQAFKQTPKMGFYTKLKMKLKRQIEKIEAKKSQSKENLLVQGCKIFKCDSSIQVNRKPLTERPRPQSSLTRTGLEYQSSQYTHKDRRPKTSRSRTVQRKEIEYMSATADDIFKKKPKTRPRTSGGNLVKKGQHHHYQSAMNKTLRHVNQIHLKQNCSVTKMEIKNEKIKERMLTLLVECDNHTTDFRDLDSGLKVFESYTNRMNKGLSQVSKFLEDAGSINDYYPQFIEK